MQAQPRVAAVVRVSTDDQDDDRQRDSILAKYPPEDYRIEWFVDIESGASQSRAQYNDMRERVDEFDIVTATEIDRLGRSFSELANLVEELKDRDIGLDCTEQPISTVDADDWMAEMLLNIMIVFADAERRMIQDRVQQGVDRAKRQGKRVGKPPTGYEVDEDGFMFIDAPEYAKVQDFIREVKKGRAKKPTARFYGIPSTAIQGILERAEQNYEIEFDNDEWKMERARVESGEKEIQPLPPLDGDDR